jgi:hypothetical protein
VVAPRLKEASRLRGCNGDQAVTRREAANGSSADRRLCGPHAAERRFAEILLIPGQGSCTLPARTREARVAGRDDRRRGKAGVRRASRVAPACAQTVCVVAGSAFLRYRLPPSDRRLSLVVPSLADSPATSGLLVHAAYRSGGLGGGGYRLAGSGSLHRDDGCGVAGARERSGAVVADRAFDRSARTRSVGRRTSDAWLRATLPGAVLLVGAARTVVRRSAAEAAAAVDDKALSGYECCCV